MIRDAVIKHASEPKTDPGWFRRLFALHLRNYLTTASSSETTSIQQRFFIACSKPWRSDAGV